MEITVLFCCLNEIIGSITGLEGGSLECFELASFKINSALVTFHKNEYKSEQNLCRI